MRVLAAFVAALASVTCMASAASAQTPSEDPDAPSAIAWRWRRHHPVDYVATGVFAATALVTEVVPERDQPRWLAGNDFDDAVMEAFGLNDHDDRQIAARFSDVTLTALVTHRIVVDAMLVAWVGHGDGDTAWQLAALDAQAMMFTLAATGGAKRAFERERPSSRSCRTEIGYDQRCTEQSRDGSFFSGHTSLAFTAATLTCTHHLQLPLYGGQGDVIACVAAELAAASVAFERILADRHYASDVLAGAGLGLLSGGLLPWLSFHSRPSPSTPHISLSPAAYPGGLGISFQALQ